MIPDIDLQLRVVMKALRDVVAPAVNPEDRLAIEQLQLAMATLGMVQSRLPALHPVARLELSNAIDLAEAAEQAGGTKALGGVIASGRALLDNANARTAQLEACRTELAGAVSGLVRDTAEPAAQQAIARAILAASKPQCDLARAWGLPSGFEPDPDEVPDLETLLRGPTDQS